jgi:uncharacterized protein (DUF1697 family)
MAPGPSKAPPASRAAATHVVLLRGVNVGGRNRLTMEALARLLEAAGGRGVRTYVQSGNAVFSAGAAVARRVPAELARRLEEALGLQVPVVVRAAEELRELVRRNPFPQGAADPRRLHVAFLAEAPSPAAARALDPARSPPDAFAVRGREVYLWLPNGVAGTRLTNDYLDRTLGTVSTIRSWRTVLALEGLLDPHPT